MPDRFVQLAQNNLAVGRRWQDGVSPRQDDVRSPNHGRLHLGISQEGCGLCSRKGLAYRWHDTCMRPCRQVPA